MLKTDSYSFCPLGITEQTAASSNPLDPDSSSSDCKNANSSAPVSASKPNSSLLGQALRQEAANRPPPSSALSTPLVGAAHASAASDLIACPGENPSEVYYYAFNSCRAVSFCFQIVSPIDSGLCRQVLIWDYRSGKTLHRLHASLDSTAPVNTGMCMCLKMADSASTGTPLVACGFESGHLTLHDLRRPDYALSCSALHKEPRSSAPLTAIT